MSVDPAWDLPVDTWGQQGSFVEAVTPPSVDPAAGTPVCIGPLAWEWVPLMLGALDQLRGISTWLVTDQTALTQVLNRVDQLKEIVAMASECCTVAVRLNAACVLQYSIDGGTTWVDVTGWAANFATCVQQATVPQLPILPPGSTPAQRACDIAAYVANSVVKEAMAQAINTFNNNLSLLQLAEQVAASVLAFEFPWTTAFIYAVYDFYAYFSSTSIPHFTTAEGDATLWAAVTCAIYEAIVNDGQITATNAATVISNICALNYTYTDVIQAICAFVTQLGANGLMSLQIGGALTVGDCVGCGGGWCHEFDFTQGAQGWVVNPNAACSAVQGPTGWVGCYSAAFNLTEIALVYSTTTNLGQDVTITGFSVWVEDDQDVAAGEQRQLIFAEGATYVYTGTFTTNVVQPLTKLSQDEPPPQPAFNGIYFNWYGSGQANNRIAYLQLRGTGANPFGANNCIH